MAKTVTEFLSVFNETAVWFCDHETDLLILLDSHGCFERVYPGLTEALGYSEYDVFGRPLIDLIDIDDLAEFIKSFGKPLAERLPIKMLHKHVGFVAIRLERFEFLKNNGYIILRRI